MTDLSIQSTPAARPSTYEWLAGDSGAFENAQSGTLRVASLTEGVHYDAATKTIVGGIVLAKIPAGSAGAGQFAPWNPTATNGLEIVAGILPDNISIWRPDGTKPTVLIIPVVIEATIIPAKLPIAAQRVFDANVKTTGTFRTWN